jgi:hypothetical protein
LYKIATLRSAHSKSKPHKADLSMSTLASFDDEEKSLPPAFSPVVGVDNRRF